MDLTSTHYLSYREIKTDGIDLIEDAFGFYAQFGSVLSLLNILKPIPGKRLTNRLIRKIRK